MELSRGDTTIHEVQSVKMLLLGKPAIEKLEHIPIISGAYWILVASSEQI